MNSWHISCEQRMTKKHPSRSIHLKTMIQGNSTIWECSLKQIEPFSWVHYFQWTGRRSYMRTIHGINGKFSLDNYLWLAHLASFKTCQDCRCKYGVMSHRCGIGHESLVIEPWVRVRRTSKVKLQNRIYVARMNSVPALPVRQTRHCSKRP